MSNLLLQWINHEVQLSRTVTRFQEFRDGFLLGELLFRYNQQPDFPSFQDRSTPTAALHNFQLLEPNLRRLGVKFNSRTIAQVMAGEETVTKGLLYEIRVNLETIARASRTALGPALWGTRSDRIATVVPTSRPHFDATRSKTFQTVMRGLVENPNTVMLSEATEKYKVRTGDYDRNVSLGESLAQDTVTLNRLRARDIIRTKRERENEFSAAWEALQLEKWKENQSIAAARRERIARVDAREESKQKARIQRLKEETKVETLASLDAFENRLRTMIPSSSSKPEVDCVRKTLV